MLQAGIGENELSRGAADTAFQDRIWHYCNWDGTFRNGARQVASKDQPTKVIYGTGDRIEVLLDIEQREVRFRKNAAPVEGVLRDVCDLPFLQAQEEARLRNEEPAEGLGEFLLLLSMSPGDHVEVEESPYGLSYPSPDATYPWGTPIAPNEPRVAAGTGPLRFSADRPLPDGLTLDATTGVVTGVPSGKSALDAAGWRRFCFQMYRGRLGDQGWGRARTALLKELGTGLGEAELRDRAAALFRMFDADGSGGIEFSELKGAMDALQVRVSDEELTVPARPHTHSISLQSPALAVKSARAHTHRGTRPPHKNEPQQVVGQVP